MIAGKPVPLPAGEQIALSSPYAVTCTTPFQSRPGNASEYRPVPSQVTGVTAVNGAGVVDWEGAAGVWVCGGGGGAGLAHGTAAPPPGAATAGPAPPTAMTRPADSTSAATNPPNARTFDTVTSFARRRPMVSQAGHADRQ